LRRARRPHVPQRQEMRGTSLPPSFPSSLPPSLPPSFPPSPLSYILSPPYFCAIPSSFLSPPLSQ
jgi:hypothetical protein